MDVRDLYRRYVDYDIDVVAEQRALAPRKPWSCNIRCTGTTCRRCSSSGSTKCSNMAGPMARAALRCAARPCRGGQYRRLAFDSMDPEGNHGHPIEAFLLPLEQTARLCGMDWLPPLVLRDADNTDAQALAAHIARVCRRIGAHETTPGAAWHGDARMNQHDFLIALVVFLVAAVVAVPVVPYWLGKCWATCWPARPSGHRAAPGRRRVDPQFLGIWRCRRCS
ncbi:NAD(P)H-dependent oxidoreductase [Cupriavidus basilensis]